MMKSVCLHMKTCFHQRQNFSESTSCFTEKNLILVPHVEHIQQVGLYHEK